ncbi:MAG: DUF2790 domain-containing protein [Pseudomonadaceae bacterium]|nr:DUF2790 domain-containing protein [Pseudomonadaceae bacterium]
MKALVVLALVGVSGVALAAQESVVGNNQQPAKVEHYSYSMNLDIAQVISRSPASDACGVVPARIVYDDSHGQRHILEYSELGNGCSGS